MDYCSHIWCSDKKDNYIVYIKSKLNLPPFQLFVGYCLDHSILLYHLLSGLAYHLVLFSGSPCTYYMHIVHHHLSPSSLLTCGISQGSILGPILSISISPLSVLSSALQLAQTHFMLMTPTFLSFIPKNFSSSITEHESTVSFTSSRMSLNFLTQNPSKSKFLLLTSFSKHPQ